MRYWLLPVFFFFAIDTQAQFLNGGFSTATLGDCNAGMNWIFSSSPNEPEVSCHFDDISNLCIDLTPCHQFGNGTWIEQQVSTAPGQWYQIEMDLATLCGWDGSDAGVQIYIDHLKLCHRVFNDEFTCIPDSLNWKRKRSDFFQASGYMTTIRIEGFSLCSGLNGTCPKGTIGNPGFIGLDNVNLIPVSRPDGSKIEMSLRLCDQSTLDARPYSRDFDTYLWSTGAVSDTLTISASGTYSVIIRDSCRVVVSDTIVFTVSRCDTLIPEDSATTLVLPSAFTPNGDNQNEIFRIIYKGYPSLAYFHIYNRWGQQVYSSIDITQGWDGRYNNEPQPPGIYTYSITYYDSDRRMRSLFHSFELIR